MSQVHIGRGVVARMLRHARAEAPRECCGLLAGEGEEITAACPCANALASASAYEIAPQELIAQLKAMRARGLRLLGIYHSHSRADNFPSPADIERAYYPDAFYFIISLARGASQPVRAFRIGDRGVSEIEVLSR